MQANACLVKSLDADHPVASILGEINVPSLAEVYNIVSHSCTAVDVWGAPPDAFPLMQALKARLDPDRRLSPGRFVGGL